MDSDDEITKIFNLYSDQTLPLFPVASRALVTQKEVTFFLKKKIIIIILFYLIWILEYSPISIYSGVTFSFSLSLSSCYFVPLSLFYNFPFFYSSLMSRKMEKFQ